MYIERRIYLLEPGTVSEYLRLYEEIGYAIQQPILGNLVGYFYSEIGRLNEVMHMWSYEDLIERQRRRDELARNTEWQSYLELIMPMIVSMESTIMQGASMSPIR